MKRVVLYALVGGILVALLRYVEYWTLVRRAPGEIYGGVIAILFTIIGFWLGMTLRERRRPGRSSARITERADSAAVERLGITPREHEILELIASGLSNREIGETLFVSENTVKTHSSRLLRKLDARRRTEAVHRARELGVIR